MKAHTLQAAFVAFALMPVNGCSNAPTDPDPDPVHTPTTLQIAQTTIALDQGSSLSIVAQVLDQDGVLIANSTIQFASSNSALATVDAAGRVTSVGPAGSATITVTSGSLTGTVAVTVNQVATSIALSPPTLILRTGASWILYASVLDFVNEVIAGATVTFASSAPTVASVDAAGQVAGLTVGSATVTVTAGAATAAVTVTVTAPNALLLSGSPFGIDISSAGVAYITRISGNAVARIDLPSLVVQQVLNIGAVPAHLAFAPNGTKAYVTLQTGQALAEIDVATNTELRRLALTSDGFNLAVSRDGQTVYTTTGGGRVDFVDATTLTSQGFVQLSPVTNGLVEHPTAPLLYVSSRNGGTLSEINTATRTVVREFAIGGMPQRVVITPDGNTVFVANEVNGVDVVDLVTGTVGTPIDLAGDGLGLAMTSDGSLLFVSLPQEGLVKVIDVERRVVVGSNTVGGTPRNIAITDDDSIIMIPNEGGWIDVINR